MIASAPAVSVVAPPVGPDSTRAEEDEGDTPQRSPRRRRSRPRAGSGPAAADRRRMATVAELLVDAVPGWPAPSASTPASDWGAPAAEAVAEASPSRRPSRRVAEATATDRAVVARTAWSAMVRVRSAPTAVRPGHLAVAAEAAVAVCVARSRGPRPRRSRRRCRGGGRGDGGGAHRRGIGGDGDGGRQAPAPAVAVVVRRPAVTGRAAGAVVAASLALSASSASVVWATTAAVALAPIPTVDPPPPGRPWPRRRCRMVEAAETVRSPAAPSPSRSIAPSAEAVVVSETRASASELAEAEGAARSEPATTSRRSGAVAGSPLRCSVHAA